MPMRTLPAPPQDQSTAMNAATPSIQDFVDRTRLVERRLRTSDTMRCPDCGQALPKPTGGYRAAIRCGCRVWLPSRARRSYPATTNGPASRRRCPSRSPVGTARRVSSAPGPRRHLDHVGTWTTSGAVQCGVVPNAAECRAYQRHLTQLQRQEQRRTEMAHGGTEAERYQRPAFPHTDDPHLLEQRRRRAAPSRARYEAEPPPPRTWTASNAASGAAGRYNSKRSAPSPATTAGARS